ncbi:MAG: hypothetical protein V4649_00370 [Bacteroidota bacterium]
MIKAVIPECNIDTNLVNTFLGVEGKRGANHTKGVSTVSKKMQEKFSNSFSLGIIDKDKKEIAYLKEFEVLAGSIAEHSILYKHRTKHHYFIQLCPESEDWICSISKALGIDLESKHKMPSLPKQLGEITKKVVSKEDQKFTGLFKDILKRSEETNFEPVLKLRNWLRILVRDTYQADINELRK